MRFTIHYVALFVGAIIGSVYLHEIGHAVAGWIIGVAVVPTPAKEYILQPELSWNREIWVALGGPVGTGVAAVAGVIYFWLRPRANREAVFVGAFLPIALYSVRFLLVGRGHDNIEFQAAQTALGFPAMGHGLDIIFLCLFILGLLVWFFHVRPSLRTLLGLTALGVAGLVLLIALQVGNNLVFDRLFPSVRLTNVPAFVQPQ